MGLDGLTTYRVTVEVQTPPVAVKYEAMLDGLSYVPERVNRGCTHDELGDPSEAHPAGGGRRYGTLCRRGADACQQGSMESENDPDG
jgi:hypothetical protein